MKTMYTGKLLTMDATAPAAEAMLVENGRIRAVGTRTDLTALAADAHVDFGEAAIIPGFIDGHSHLSAFAQKLLILDLSPPPAGTCACIADLLHMLRTELDTHPERYRHGRWLVGMGWDESALVERRPPLRRELDEGVSADIPILLSHVSGHLAAVNSRAMTLLGYSGADFAVPDGGRVTPDGLLAEQAYLSPEKQQLIHSASPEEAIRAVADASRIYASRGITTAQDARTGMSELRFLQAADARGYLTVDTALYLTPDACDSVLDAARGYDGHLRPAGMKLFLDGSPQGKTACLSAPYLEPPAGESADYCGFLTMADTDVERYFQTCIERRWQVNVHVNGDAAIDQFLRCMANAEVAAHQSSAPLRPVMIHCQTVRADQLDVMQRTGVMPSYFHDHVYYWGDYHRTSVLGEARASHISPLRSTELRGIPFTLHRDAPVLPPDPLFSLWCAVNRLTATGYLLGGEERISVETALRALTTWGAYQLFEESDKGALRPGMRADFTVLDRSPLACASEQLREIDVLAVYKDGCEIFS